MNCTLCPRQCHAQRDAQHGAGRCRMPSLPVIARAALHMWEEPPISGTNGSGTIFFSGCSLSCIYCQNTAISQEDYGLPVSTAQLREVCLALISQGAHNINFVNPTHYAHQVLKVLQEPLPVPVIWNSGGYDRVETLRHLEGRVQIYLPDLKYLEQDAAARWSDAADYPEVAQAAITEMVRQTGPYAIEQGRLTRGTVIRHLILPNCVREAKSVMDWVARSFPAGTVLFSLMRQYVPMGQATQSLELGRQLRGSEARAAASYMAQLGLDGFVQETGAAVEDFIPDFDLTGVPQ